MTSGINDTKVVKATIGMNIKRARKEKGLSMQAFADKVATNGKAPVLRGKRDTISVDRLKMWENGTNPVELEWIPAFCDVLECDVGFLFGEYKEHTKCKANICSETGLSEKAADSLIGLYNYGPTESFKTLVTLLENEGVWKFMGHREEEVTGLNPITAIGNYLFGDNPVNGLMLPNGERICGENYQFLKSLISRMYLDQIQDIMKSIKNNFSDPFAGEEHKKERTI